MAKEETIPSNWRIAKLIPVYKKGPRMSIENYRPISNICTLSKVYERLILGYISDLEKRSGTSLSGSHQHGFVKYRSTSSACLSLQNKLAKILGNKKYAVLYSTDLSAAFDMLNPELFKLRTTNMGLPKILINILYDYLKNRTAYVEIGNETSDLFDIILGCVQGSVLGPIIFNIFMRPLADEIENVTSYADDTYGVIELDTLDLALVSTKVLDHLKWLRQSGMLVNEKKTEIMIMHRNEKIIETFDFGEKVKSISKMSILGIIFNQNLTWAEHVEQNINRCLRIFHGVKIVRKFFNQEKFKQVVTSFLFSKLFYGFEVWSYDLLSYDCKRKLDSFYYKICRLIINDFECVVPRIEINKIVKRATPFEFSQYCTARATINAINFKTPLSEVFNTSYNINRKPGRLFFFDNSKTKVEKNMITNRISDVFKKLEFTWLNVDFEKLRPKLKKCLFKYAD